MSKGDDMPAIAEIEFTPAQKLGQSILRPEQVDKLQRKWFTGGNDHLTHREMELLFRTTLALSDGEGELWEQIDTLHDELAEAQAKPASTSSSPWPGVVALSVFLVCLTAIVVAFIAAY